MLYPRSGGEIAARTFVNNDEAEQRLYVPIIIRRRRAQRPHRSKSRY